MLRSKSSGDLLTHSRLPRSDPSLEEFKSRSPACSLSKAQAALEGVWDGSKVALHSMRSQHTSGEKNNWTKAETEEEQKALAGVSTTFRSSQTNQLHQSKHLKG